MNLHAFYNREYVGDTLLIRLTDQREVTSHQRLDDLCVLYHDQEVIGFNLFHASHYISDLQSGKVKITPQFVESLNKILIAKQQDCVTSDYDDHFYVGKIIDIKEHPDSDHMHVCQVDIGQKVLQIVCGAPNVAIDQCVVVATIGAIMPSGLMIKPSELRGIESHGMLCSARELALPNAPLARGIMILNENEYRIGESFFR